MDPKLETLWLVWQKWIGGSHYGKHSQSVRVILESVFAKLHLSVLKMFSLDVGRVTGNMLYQLRSKSHHVATSAKSVGEMEHLGS